MNAVVKAVLPGSPAFGSIITPGDILRRINNCLVEDILDYMYLSYEEELLIELRSQEGKIKLVKLSKQEGADIGLEFDSFLMDNERSCGNKCVFCFIDQLPKGMRETLYYKDDDLRLSFLQGNYITLSNLSENDISRIVELRISPINVSIHTMNPVLRAYMLGTKRAAQGIGILEYLAGNNIVTNCQIVCCPGVNDGDELSYTIKELMNLGESINSVSIVPVGLSKHREGLSELRSFDTELARKTIHLVNEFGDKCLKEQGKRKFYCADELYIIAKLDLPSDEYYEEFPQLENGVGMMRLFISEFEEALEYYDMAEDRNPGLDSLEIENDENKPFSIATGTAAKEFLSKLMVTASKKHDRISGTIYEIKNDYFGESITVSGLLTGRDIIAQLKGKDLGHRLLIPRNMLKSDEDIFLDDITLEQLSEALEIPVRVVVQNGADFLKAILGH
ncbi:MAG: DUF512 domain-containing protein [Oscillospiraceae bacterium]|nr:DUF512 domain-containing protein [Oscillospiraceae bacterium]